jgi:hypothetical protein
VLKTDSQGSRYYEIRFFDHTGAQQGVLTGLVHSDEQPLQGNDMGQTQEIERLRKRAIALEDALRKALEHRGPERLEMPSPGCIECHEKCSECHLTANDIRQGPNLERYA